MTEENTLSFNPILRAQNRFRFVLVECHALSYAQTKFTIICVDCAEHGAPGYDLLTQQSTPSDCRYELFVSRRRKELPRLCLLLNQCSSSTRNPTDEHSLIGVPGLVVLEQASFLGHTSTTPSAQRKKKGKKDCMQIQLFLANDGKEKL